MKRLRQHGMTLVELMIALVLGLVVILLPGSLFISANAGFAAQREQAAVDDAARFALATIERAARQAGYVDWQAGQAAAERASAPAFINGLDAASLSRSAEGIGAEREPAANGSDVLALRFGGAGHAPDGDGSMLNCAGFAVDGQREGWSIFYVGISAGGQSELRCKYRGENNWSADAVVAGVDSFQVLYGLDTDLPSDGLANEYVSATALHALDAQLVLQGASDSERERDRNRRTHWKRVTAIKVALVLHGAPRIGKNGKEAVFELFGPAYGEAAAGVDEGVRIDEALMTPAMRNRERRGFSAAILLRNPAD
ncbi:MAG: PilW family protein [Pseudomonadota bacterium]